MNERINKLKSFNNVLGTVHGLAGKLAASVETVDAIKAELKDIEALQYALEELRKLAAAA